jgi:hypothetical protein
MREHLQFLKNGRIIETTTPSNGVVMNQVRFPKFAAIAAILLFLAQPFASAKDQKPNQAPPISKQTKLQLTRLLSSEFVWTRKAFPLGNEGIVIMPNGDLNPDGPNLEKAVMARGMAAKAGERVQITDVKFKGSEIVLEINGGSKKKTKWYQHIEVGIGNNTAQAPDSGPAPKGTYLTMEFKGYVPEVTLDELKARMNPVVDFSVKSATQAYVETLPPIARKAIENHEALVGMNKEMVTESMGRPPKRIRDKDDQNRSYEEWIFGEPPQDVEFVRFVGDEVVRVEVMKVNGDKIVRTQREITLNDPAVATAQPKPVTGPRPANAPTLRRPGEEIPDTDPNGIQTRVPNPRPSGTSTDPGPPKTFISSGPAR